MIVKKFQAETETEAILKAKDELGSGAVVLNVKTLKQRGVFRLFKKDVVEVTAALEEKEFINGINNKKPTMENKGANSGFISSQPMKNITGGSQINLVADEKIDIFLIEADYALKYVDSDYTLDVVNDIGLSKDALADQYQYTKDIVTDSKGVQKGTTWQATPGLFAYRRSIAKDVLGTDDPDAVQAQLSSWDKFNAVAEKASEKGYKMLSGYDDAYRVFSNNVSAPWVDSNNKIVIDDNIMKWVDDSKAQVDAGETGTCDLWSDDWSKGFYPQGKVFCYFGPAWLVNFSMAADTEGSIGYNGGWGAAQGPQGFFWGGTWICAAQGTDNANLVKDIMLKMTTDDDIMKDIVVDDDDFVNNSTVMNGLADGSIKVKDNKEYSSKILGGQNPLPMYCAGVETLDLSNLSSYDQGCNEEFQNAMKNYFEGKASKEEALDLFYKAVTEKYPELTY